MNRLIYVSLTLFITAVSCNTQKKASKFRFDTPEAGTLVKQGESIPLKLVFPSEVAFDSVVYAVDGEVLARTTDSTAVSLDTETAPFGSRTLSAKLYHEGKEQVTYSNIVVVPPAPKRYGFKVVNEYPHDPEAYTQGLEFDSQGVLYESTGREGQSSIRKVDYKTGKILQKVDLGPNSFGEGLCLIGDRVIQLTWREKTGYVYDKHTLAKTAEFSYGQSPEGWGICYDGKRLIKSDGSSKLYFLNKDTYAEEGSIEVYSDKGPMDNLNELEYINGMLYANVYTKDFIVIINPETGAIEGEINLIGIYPDKQEFNNELNGIAYDRQGKRLFITGKNWPTLYEIEQVAK